MAALALGLVAGGIGGREHLLDTGRFLGDFHQANAGADAENAVAPHEAMISDAAADFIGDLPRLIERATYQQHAELIAAEAPDGVRVAYPAAHQLGDIAQQAVAGLVAAGVVDGLEAVQIQITQHVIGVAAMRCLDRLLQAALELTAVHQAGECVMRGLVGNLARQAARFGDIVQ